MRRNLFVSLTLLLLASVARGEDYLLPVFALNIPGKEGTEWTSEVYVTNPGSTPAVVTEGALLLGRISDGPRCLPIVQPFLRIPPRTTLLWPIGNLSLGIGCPSFAVGGLTFRSDTAVEISSRMINHTALRENPPATRLTGIGQEIPAVALPSLPRAEQQMILPGIGWHPNSCGPSQLDTNVFWTNPTNVRVTVRLEPAPDMPREMLIDGTLQSAPFIFSVERFSQRSFRLAGPGSPMLPVCLNPVVGAFSYRADGPIGVVASIIDRRSGDPRTSLPLRATE